MKLLAYLARDGDGIYRIWAKSPKWHKQYNMFIGNDILFSLTAANAKLLFGLDKHLKRSQCEQVELGISLQILEEDIKSLGEGTVSD